MDRKKHFLDIPIIIVFIAALLVLIFGVLLSDERFCMTLEGDLINESDLGERCFPTLKSLRNYSEFMATKYNKNNNQYSNMYISDNSYLNNTE